jgi:hypothetical protein
MLGILHCVYLALYDSEIKRFEMKNSQPVFAANGPASTPDACIIRHRARIASVATDEEEGAISDRV